jgi:hypothetical protein
MTGNGRNNGHRGNGHKTETPDVSHIRNVEVTHERSDISVSGVATFIVALTVAAIVIQIGVWLMFRYFNAQEAKEPRPGPMALQKEERLPPEPRLQAAPGFAVTLQDGTRVDLQANGPQAGTPQAEYRVLRQQWQQELQGELKDQSGNPIGMPIDQAMKQIVSGGGLPTRAQVAPAKVEDYGVSLPTDSSSGRETVKRRQ